MGFNIFLTFGVLFFASLIAYIIINYIRKKDLFSILNKAIIIFFIFTLIILIGLSIYPYMMQQKDEALIRQFDKNIKTYENYSENYADAARKQIKEYSKLQEEMASYASMEQLQFWSKQRDEISDSISQKINEYQENILQQKLKINEAQSRIETRLRNKWFFGL